MKIYNNNIIDLETFKKVKDSPRRRRQLLNGTLSQDTFQLTNPQLQGFSGIARKIAKETPQLETMCRQLEKILEYDIPRIDIFTGVFYAIKTEAEKAISEIKQLGAHSTVMLSGDVYHKAQTVAERVKIDEVKAELLPEEKYAVVDSLSRTGDGVIYVGDGINDAPALASATIGVAMGAIGSDSAIEAADVVIMSDDLSRIPKAVKIARKSLRIAKQNIVFALGVKGAILLLSALGLSFMWLAIFADVGVAVIAILNSMRALRTGK